MDEFIPTQKTKVFRVKVPLEKGREFESVCKNENKNINAKLKELIEESTKVQKRYFYAGRILIDYERQNDKFVWRVILENGKKVLVLDNLNIDFIKQIKEGCEKAIQERNDWIHGKEGVSIPSKLLEDENERI